MRRWFAALPGPTPVKLGVAVVAAVLALLVLFFVYDWIGGNLLDSGGTLG